MQIKKFRELIIPAAEIREVIRQERVEAKATNAKEAKKQDKLEIPETCDTTVEALFGRNIKKITPESLLDRFCI